jgi:nucleoside diphosphate kinase
MDTVVKATFTIIDDDSKAKRTEVIEMIYPMDEERNFIKSLISYLESDDDPMISDTPKIVTGH